MTVPGGCLRDAGEPELADRLAYAVKDATPSVAVDGKLIWIGDCPPIVDFVERLEQAPGASRHMS